jgi:hypothetical protein
VLTCVSRRESRTPVQSPALSIALVTGDLCIYTHLVDLDRP